MPAVSCPIHRHARARPDALALWTPERRWTYAALDAAVAATGERLEATFPAGAHRIGLHLHRGTDSVLLLWALWRTGRVAVPLSTRLPSAQVHRAARRAGVGALVTRASNFHREETLRTYAPRQVVEREGESTPRPDAQSLHRRASIVFTSGSTGRPTAVLHTWANHLYSAKGSNANLPVRPGDRWLLSLPLYHVGGLAILVRCALAGGAVALPDRDASLATVLNASGATHLSLVATQLRRLLDAWEGPPPRRMRGLLLGGGPLPSPLLRRGHARGWPLLTSYGSTEMASQVTTTAPGAPLGDLHTAGRCLPHRRVRIDGDGQILVAGPTLCRGVVAEDRVRDPRVRGWYPTGDLGHLDAQGRLHVKGRADRQFVSGGENIRPEEIEAAFERIEGIERAVVVPVPDEEYGRRPVAFVQPTIGPVPTDWRDRLGTVLPGFKIPDAVHPLPEAAVQNRMKVDRDHLARRAREIKHGAAEAAAHPREAEDEGAG